MQSTATALAQSAKQGSSDTSSFVIDAYSQKDVLVYSEVASFIETGYQTSFGAEISVTMPVLVAIKDGQSKAALGLRGHHQPFFIEQYLAQPVEYYVQSLFPSLSMQDAVEIGSLYSNAHRLTVPLLMIAVLACFFAGKRLLMLCGTSQVLNLLSKLGVSYQKIAGAKQTDLRDSSEQWGDYYQSNPQVVVVNLDGVTQLIADNKFYQKLLARLSNPIMQVRCKLAGQL